MKNLLVSLCFMLFCMPTISIAASVNPVVADKSPAKPAAASLERDEKFIALGQTAHFNVSDLSCEGDVGAKELWLDGMDTGVRAIGCDAEQKLLVFNLTRTGAVVNKQTSEAWLTLLRRPFAANDGRAFERDVSISLRQKGEVFATGSGKLKLLDKPQVWEGALILLAVLGMLLFGIFKSGLIRDSGLPPDGRKENRPYSLARVQMVWWFAIVFISYVLLWLLMRELPGIPVSALGLIGMAGGTALAAAALDQDRPVPKTKGFWFDISTDENGVTLPRLQQIAWTSLLGIVFLSQVLTQLAMPDFDASVLALMGISAGTYLGFKVPEKQGGDAAAAPEPGGADDDGKAGYGVQ